MGEQGFVQHATFQGTACTTADIFRQDENGYFFYEGRSDDLLKVSGIWVSPLEIENCLRMPRSPRSASSARRTKPA
ncbi:MAG: hypothetical protein R3E96_09090 [Planctomycetota bacterium]